MSISTLSIPYFPIYFSRFSHIFPVFSPIFTFAVYPRSMINTLLDILGKVDELLLETLWPMVVNYFPEDVVQALEEVSKKALVGWLVGGFAGDIFEINM